MPKIKIIVGSTRPGRFGITAGEWIYNIAKERTDADYELVDLKDQNLPLLDEKQPASSGQYENDHTKAWAKVIADADGFIFVTGEYNHGIPAALKNAIDYLYAEWNHKPVSFVSYGADAGGIRAVEQLRQVIPQLKMHGLTSMVSIKNFWEHFDETGKFNPTDDITTSANAVLDEIAFWSGALQAPRQELAAK